MHWVGGMTPTHCSCCYAVWMHVCVCLCMFGYAVEWVVCRVLIKVCLQRCVFVVGGDLAIVCVHVTTRMPAGCDYQLWALLLLLQDSIRPRC